MARRSVSHANRGAALETWIEQANRSYIAQRIAQVQKVATPTKVLDDRQGGKKVIREKSTVDFVGVWRGAGLAFDAKTNRRPNLFPLDSIHQHQVDFLLGWALAGGIAFLLIFQEQDQAVYLVPMDTLTVYWVAWRRGGRASIPTTELRLLPRVRPGRGCTLDYLAALESLDPQSGGTAWRFTN